MLPDWSIYSPLTSSSNVSMEINNFVKGYFIIQTEADNWKEQIKLHLFFSNKIGFVISIQP